MSGSPFRHLLLLLLTLTGCEGVVGEYGQAEVLPTESPPAEPTPSPPAVDQVPAGAPLIAAFHASPASGTAPLATTLSWTIESPKAGSLRCSIDVGADGTTEHQLPSCDSASTLSVVVSEPGSMTVALTVQDLDGLGATQTLQLLAKAPIGELSIAKVDWGQSVIATTPRLVSGKPALFRIHVVGDRPGLTGVTVKAEGFRNGLSLGALSLSGPASPPTTVVDDNLDQQFRAVVPAAWITSGLQIRVTVDPDDALAEFNETNNELVVSPEIGTGTVLHLTSVPVIHAGLTPNTPDVEPLVQRVWPIRNVATNTRAPYTFSGSLTSQGFQAWQTLLQNLAALRQADGSQRYYYGFVRVTYGAGIAGIGYVGLPVATGRHDSLDTFAHELGHNMGRSHAPCGGAASPDPAYPYAGGAMGSLGYDSLSNQLVPLTQVVNGQLTPTRDLMGYCSPEWISDFNYRAVQSFLESNPPVAADAAPRMNVMLISGKMTKEGVSLSPLQRIRTTPSASREGPYTLRMYADGTLQTHSFDVDVVADAENERHFSFLVPDPGELSAVEVLEGEQVLLRRLAQPFHSSNEVRIEEGSSDLEVRWDSARHPYASVAHLGPDERTTLALWLEGGSLVIRKDGLPEGGVYEVSLSDGLNAVRFELAR